MKRKNPHRRGSAANRFLGYNPDRVQNIIPVRRRLMNARDPRRNFGYKSRRLVQRKDPGIQSL
jgi:hypothetical protein